MKDLSSFILHAKADVKAKQISHVLLSDSAALDTMLLYAAYRKRIRPVPSELTAKATQQFMQSTTAARVNFGSDRERDLIFDRVMNACWDTLPDEKARRVWLLKVI